MALNTTADVICKLADAWLARDSTVEARPWCGWGCRLLEMLVIPLKGLPKWNQKKPI